MAGLMNSGASCLPVSSFPNANSFAQRRTGEKDEVLTTWDYIKSGVPMVCTKKEIMTVFLNKFFEKKTKKQLLMCAGVLLSMGYGLFQAF